MPQDPLLSLGSEFLSGAMPKAGGEPATYSRGLITIAVIATPINADRLTDNQFGATAHDRRDFLIAARQLDTLGNPKWGDTITTAQGTYRVMSREGDDVWRWVDQFHNQYRVHTVLIQEP